MNLEQLLRLSIQQVEARKAAERALAVKGRYGRYLKRHALEKLKRLNDVI